MSNSATGESEIEKAACERAERAEAKASEFEAKCRNLIANNLRQVTELKEAKEALNVQVQVVQNENGKLLADIETAKISNEDLAGKRDHHLEKVKELTRAKTDFRRDLEKQRKRGDEAERRSEELLIEAETAKSSLQAQIDELKQTKVTEVVEIATQTGDCRSATRSAEAGSGREEVGKNAAEAEPNTVRGVKRDKCSGKDAWVCMNEECGHKNSKAVGVAPKHPTCRRCGTFRGYISNKEYWDVVAQVQSYEKRKKSESFVRQRGRGSHTSRGRGK